MRSNEVTAAQHGVHQDGWNHTAKSAFFVALSFVRFVGESRPSSRRYPGKERRDLREPLAGFFGIAENGV
jgi:hypothetical protein